MNAPDSTIATETEHLTRRYPGVRPFRDKPEEQALFFGRKPEIEQLHLRVLSVSLLVQFAKSGLGKTSLLQAGLFPLLRQKPFLPVLVRLNQEEPLVHSVAKAVENACHSEALEFTVGDTSGPWEFLASTFVWREDLLLTPVLVFDQFEEVFTLRSKEFREELARELAALASGNPPERLRAARTGISQEHDSKARVHLPKVKIIISLREKYLGALEEFSHAIPQLFEERLRLGPISELGAREAIEEPAHKPARADGAPYGSPSFEFEPQAIESIIAFLKGKSGIIELFQLQLLCQHAEDLVVDKSKSKLQVQTEPIQIALTDLGGTKGFASVLERFYKNTIDKLPKSQRSKVRLLCEEGLLNSNGHRLPLDKEQIHSDYQVTEESLKILVSARLLVCEPRLDSIFYEISHDRLAESIQRTQPFRLPRKLRRRLITGGVAAFAILAAVAWGFYETNQERLRAEKLLSFMLGEKLQAEMRDVGRGDILELVQKKSEQSLRGTSINRGLAFRNSANLHRSRGHLDQARRDFLQAQAIFERLIATESDQARVEWARTIFQSGETLLDSGKLSEALTAYKQAAQIRRDIADRYPDGAPGELLDTYAWNNTPALELAESLDWLGNVYFRMGGGLEALKYHEEAILIAQDHLFETTESTRKSAEFQKLRSTPNPKAMTVLANALLGRNNKLYWITGEHKNLDPSLYIVREILRVRPLSAEPHLSESQTIFWRAIAPLEIDAETMEELKNVSDGLDMLRRVDPENALWQREWAVTQKIISDYVLRNCVQHQNNQSLCQNKDFVMMEAERQNLEGVKQLRALVDKDKANYSWRTDLAHALLGHSEFLKEKKKILDSMQALDEAIQIFSRSIRDEKDAETKTALASAYQSRASAWQDQGNAEKALKDLQQARAIVEGLINEHPGRPDYQYMMVQNLSEEIKLRGKNSDKSVVASLEKQKAEQEEVVEKTINQIKNAQDLSDDYQNPEWSQQWQAANKAKAQNKPEKAIAAYRSGIEVLLKDAEANPKQAAIWDMLTWTQHEFAVTLNEFGSFAESKATYQQALQSAKKAAEISPKNAQYQNRLGLAHIFLGDSLQANDELESARAEFHNSLVPLQAALRLKPTKSLYHSNARNVYSRIHQVDEELLKRNPERRDQLVEDQEWALQQRLYAAWKAQAFSSDKERSNHNGELLLAKRYLSKFLAFEKQNTEQALLLMEQVLHDAEKIVGDDPKNPEYRCRLGEADYAIGFLRREQSLPGWEESIRKGLLAIDWGINMTAEKEPLCYNFSNTYRNKLGEYLLQDGRIEEGKKEIEMASSVRQEAQKLWPQDENFKQ
jgi:tetratricopeptide (TPR) repeat protein